MGFLDKILGRTKPAASEMSGDEPMGSGGMADEQPAAAEGEAQPAGEDAAEQHDN